MVGRVAGGRFISPLEATGCENVNSWPVLATQADDAVLGAAIMLPDHPQIAPESKGNLFDSTEIEEALLIHVLALSDDEREAAAAQDPAVRQMLERAVADDAAGAGWTSTGACRWPTRARGSRRIEVAGVRYRLGDKVVLRPATDATPQDHLVAGRSATIERIYYDYDGSVHLGVTVDDVPGQELMRDIGRFLYFKPTEVEMRPMSPSASSRSSSPASATPGCTDDGFGGGVARGWRRASCRSGVQRHGLRTGCLDSPRGDARLRRAHPPSTSSRQGGAPGHAVRDRRRPRGDRARRRDGALIDPHAMDPRTVLRFVSATAAGPAGRHQACEPSRGRRVGLGLSPAVGARSAGRWSSSSRPSRSCAPTPPTAA